MTRSETSTLMVKFMVPGSGFMVPGSYNGSYFDPCTSINQTWHTELMNRGFYHSCSLGQRSGTWFNSLSPNIRLNRPSSDTKSRIFFSHHKANNFKVNSNTPCKLCNLLLNIKYKCLL